MELDHEKYLREEEEKLRKLRKIAGINCILN